MHTDIETETWTHDVYNERPCLIDWQLRNVMTTRHYSHSCLVTHFIIIIIIIIIIVVVVFSMRSGDEDDVSSCSQLPPAMSCCLPRSASLLNARPSSDVTSSSCHVTQPVDAGTPPQPAARPTTLSVTCFLSYCY